jgi:hypothetical protein
MHGAIRTAGNYKIVATGNNGQGCSFNYNRKESQMSYLSLDDLNELADNHQNIHVLEISNGKATIALEEISEGKKLWKLCIILALLFILLEILIIKLWKNEGPVKVSTHS